MTNRYRYVSYGLIGNKRDGFEVNDAHLTSDYYDLPEGASETEIFAALKKQGFIKKYARRAKFTTDGDEKTIYLRYDEVPAGELRAVDTAK